MSVSLINKEHFVLMCVSLITGEGGLFPQVRFLTMFRLPVNWVTVRFDQ